MKYRASIEYSGSGKPKRAGAADSGESAGCGGPGPSKLSKERQAEIAKMFGGGGENILKHIIRPSGSVLID